MDIPKLSDNVKSLKPKSDDFLKGLTSKNSSMDVNEIEKRKDLETKISGGITKFYFDLADNVGGGYKSASDKDKLFYLLSGFYRPGMLSEIRKDFAIAFNNFFTNTQKNYESVIKFKKEYLKYEKEISEFEKKSFKIFRKKPAEPNKPNYKKLDRDKIDKFFNDFEIWLNKVPEIESKILGMLNKCEDEVTEAVRKKEDFELSEIFAENCIVDEYVSNEKKNIESLFENIDENENGKGINRGNKERMSLSSKEASFKNEIKKLEEEEENLKNELMNTDERKLNNEIKEIKERMKELKEKVEMKEGNPDLGKHADPEIVEAFREYNEKEKQLKKNNELITKCYELGYIKNTSLPKAKSGLSNLQSTINDYYSGDLKIDSKFIRNLKDDFDKSEIVSKKIEEIKNAHEKIKAAFNSLY